MLRTSLVSAAGNLLKLLMPYLLCIGLVACGGRSGDDTATLKSTATSAPSAVTGTPSLLATSAVVTTGTPTLVASGFNLIDAIASDGTYIYVGTHYGQLFRMSKTGTDVRNIATVPGFIGQILFNNGNIWFYANTTAFGGATIYTMPQDLSAGPTPFLSGVVKSMGITGSTLYYWDGDNGVKSIPLAGGTPEVLLANAWPLGFAVDGTSIFMQSLTLPFPGVFRLDTVTKTVSNSIPQATASTNVFVDANNVYAGGPNILQAPKQGGTVVPLVDAPLAPGQFLGGLLSDGNFVYYIEGPGGSGLTNTLKAVPVGGGTPIPLTTTLISARYMINVNGTLYWSTAADAPGAGAVYRLDVAPPPPPSLSLDAIFQNSVRVFTNPPIGIPGDWTSFVNQFSLISKYPKEYIDGWVTAYNNWASTVGKNPVQPKDFYATGIGASFVPNPNFGLSLSQVAALTGFDHFNWFQAVTETDPTTGVAFGSPFMIDPPLGCYEPIEAITGKKCPNRDLLPWYLDEFYSVDGLRVYNDSGQKILTGTMQAYSSDFFGVTSTIIDSRRRSWTADAANTLLFSDSPNVNAVFTTCLAGVYPDGTGVVLEHIVNNHNELCFAWKNTSDNNIPIRIFEGIGSFGSNTSISFLGFAPTTANNPQFAAAVQRAGLQIVNISIPDLLTVAQMTNVVQNFGLPKGISQSLLAKLAAAAASISRENTDAARGQLGAFLHEVSAQRGKKITIEQADTLTAIATRVMRNL